MKHKLVELMIDAYNGELDKTKYSDKQAEHVIRNALKDLVSENGQFSYKMFRRNKVALFEIIEEVLQNLVNQGLRDQFKGFADVRNLSWGEKASFTIPDPNLFSVATISRSNGDSAFGYGRCGSGTRSSWCEDLRRPVSFPHGPCVLG